MNPFNMPESDSVGHVNEFLGLVVASGLLSERLLASLINEFERESSNSPLSSFGRTITGITSFLVRRGVLTCYQVERLRSGKYDGFFYADDYWILDCWGSVANGGVYLAKCVSRAEVVVIEVIHSSPPRHRVIATLHDFQTRWDVT